MESDDEAVAMALQEWVDAIVAAIGNERGVHAETAIAAAARMAGTFLLRSFGLPLETLAPGSAVLSEQANTQGPALIDILGRVLDAMGIAIDPKHPAALESQSAPQWSLFQTQQNLDATLSAINARNELDDSQAARVGTYVTAMLVRDCARVLDPQVAFGIAVYGFVEGCKTVPLHR